MTTRANKNRKLCTSDSARKKKKMRTFDTCK